MLAYLAFGIVPLLGVLGVGTGLVFLVWLAFPDQDGLPGLTARQSLQRVVRS